MEFIFFILPFIWFVKLTTLESSKTRSSRQYVASWSHSKHKFNVLVLKNWISKRIGLLNHSSLAPNEALLLQNCKRVHTRGMGFAIDVVYLDHNFEVLRTDINVEPGFLCRPGPRGTSHVLELAAGSVMQLGLSCGLKMLN
jgi:uncharacterized membrane protein (UPF0127 family)